MTFTRLSQGDRASAICDHRGDRDRSRAATEHDEFVRGTRGQRAVREREGIGTGIKNTTRSQGQGLGTEVKGLRRRGTSELEGIDGRSSRESLGSGEAHISRSGIGAITHERGVSAEGGDTGARVGDREVHPTDRDRATEDAIHVGIREDESIGSTWGRDIRDIQGRTNRAGQRRVERQASGRAFREGQGRSTRSEIQGRQGLGVDRGGLAQEG